MQSSSKHKKCDNEKQHNLQFVISGSRGGDEWRLMLAVSSSTSYEAGGTTKLTKEEESIIKMMNSHDVHEYNKNSSTNTHVINHMDCKVSGCDVQTKVLQCNGQLARYQQGYHNHIVPGPCPTLSGSSIAGSCPTLGDSDSSSNQNQKLKKQNSGKANKFPSNVVLAEALHNHADKKVASNPHHCEDDTNFWFYIAHLHGAARVICNVSLKIHVIASESCAQWILKSYLSLVLIKFLVGVCL